MNIKSYRAAFWLYVLLFSLLTFPFWGGSEVVAPYRQYNHIALTDTSGSAHIENNKFSDFTKVYIPEIDEHLHGSRTGAFALWNNENELGRPLGHFAGFSPAYLPTWLLYTFGVENPFVVITILSLVTCFLSGLFVLLFCREINIAPFAGLVAGSCLATSPLFMYWLTFPMFPSIWCWTAGVLWSVTRMAKKKGLLGWVVVAFSTYSLLMLGYPQGVVYQAYILLGYGLYLAYCIYKTAGLNATVRFSTLCALAIIVGVASASPAYVDLIHTASESLRLNADASFFTKYLPKFTTISDAIMFFALSFIPELFGNPIEMTFPFKYDGVSITLLMLFLASVCLLTSFKRTWGWWFAIMLLLALTFVEPLFLLAVKYFGFNLSPSTPLGSTLLPLIVLVAYGTNALVNRSPAKTISLSIVLSSIFVFITILIGLDFGLSQGVKIEWGTFVVTLILVGLLFVQYKRFHPWLLAASLIITIAISSFPLMLRQNQNAIAITSPLVETVRKNLPQGSRFAMAAPTVWVLEPNFNASVGLSSVHTYNSLSSRRYHKLIEALGGEMLTLGRHNLSISPDYNSAMFWMSDISLMLSKERLAHENLEYLGEESGVHLSRVNSRMGNSLQVLVPDTIELKNGSMEIGDPRLLEIHTPSKLLDFGDVLEFKLDSTKSSIFILSQKFHRDWVASVSKKGEWVPANTIDVNGVFQGVLLPSNVDMVRLEFKPFVRYMFISHIFWLLLFTVLVISIFRNKRKNQCEEVRV